MYVCCLSNQFCVLVRSRCIHLLCKVFNIPLIACSDTDNIQRYIFPTQSSKCEWSVTALASRSSDVIGFLRPGDAFEILAKHNNILKIRFQCLTGWIEEQSSPRPLPCPSTKVVMTGTRHRVMRTASYKEGIPVFNDCSTSASELGRIRPGECLEVTAYKGEWVRFRAFGCANAWTHAWNGRIALIAQGTGKPALQHLAVDFSLVDTVYGRLASLPMHRCFHLCSLFLFVLFD
jgi:hypothetical protein